MTTVLCGGYVGVLLFSPYFFLERVGVEGEIRGKIL